MINRKFNTTPHRLTYGSNIDDPALWKVRVLWLGSPIPDVHLFHTETAMSLFIDDLDLEKVNSILIWRGNAA